MATTWPSPNSQTTVYPGASSSSFAEFDAFASARSSRSSSSSASASASNNNNSCSSNNTSSSSRTTSAIGRWLSRSFVFWSFTARRNSRGAFGSSSDSSEKRSDYHLLPKSKSSSRSNSSERGASLDLESQASTLLDGEVEKRLKSSGSGGSGRMVDARVVSDAIIGLSDGLTVPFALTAGLSALGNTKVVIFAGLAELTAGAISMGLGGYLAAKSEEESYKATHHETRALAARSTAESALSVREIFEPYDLPATLTEDLAYHLSKSPHLVRFLMHFQHNSPEQEASRAFTCALTIASGYFLGGFLPLIPYFFVARDQVLHALWWSFAFMALSLFTFGYVKTCFYSGWSGAKNVWSGTKGGLQMMLVGGTAAICAMSLVRLFDSFAT